MSEGWEDCGSFDLPNISKLQQLTLNRPGAQRALATEKLEAFYA